VGVPEARDRISLAIGDRGSARERNRRSDRRNIGIRVHACARAYTPVEYLIGRNNYRRRRRARARALVRLCVRVCTVEYAYSAGIRTPVYTRPAPIISRARTAGPRNNRFCMRAREYCTLTVIIHLFLPAAAATAVTPPLALAAPPPCPASPTWYLKEFLIFYTPSYRVWPGRRARTVFRYIICLFSLHFPYLTLRSV